MEPGGAAARPHPAIRRAAGPGRLERSFDATHTTSPAGTILASTDAGHAVEADLLAAGITLEMADRDVLVPMVTLSDDEPSVTRLVDALAAAIERHRGEPRQIAPAAAWTVEPVTATDPRSAFFARHQTVSAAAAVGRVSAELIAPHPPGVPVLAPEEVISAAVLNALQVALADGGCIAYAADPTLTTIQVTAR